MKKGYRENIVMVTFMLNGPVKHARLLPDADQVEVLRVISMNLKKKRFYAEPKLLDICF
jgi:hypothetical protein